MLICLVNYFNFLYYSYAIIWQKSPVDYPADDNLPLRDNHYAVQSVKDRFKGRRR